MWIWIWRPAGGKDGIFSKPPYPLH
jgi:hypothetical protein